MEKTRLEAANGDFEKERRAAEKKIWLFQQAAGIVVDFHRKETACSIAEQAVP